MRPQSDIPLFHFKRNKIENSKAILKTRPYPTSAILWQTQIDYFWKSSRPLLSGKQLKKRQKAQSELSFPNSIIPTSNHVGAYTCNLFRLHYFLFSLSLSLHQLYSIGIRVLFRMQNKNCKIVCPSWTFLIEYNNSTQFLFSTVNKNGDSLASLHWWSCGIAVFLSTISTCAEKNCDLILLLCKIQYGFDILLSKKRGKNI